MASTTRDGNFYPVWPILDGKAIQYQWGEIRSNTAETKAVVRSSFQDIENGVDSLNALRALIGLAFGKQGFDNKYRFFYHKDDSSGGVDEFCLQKNDGTEAVPDWEDLWCIRFNDGQLQVVSEGGIAASAFYDLGTGDSSLPHDLQEISEAGATGVTTFTRPERLFFNRDHGFYISSSKAHPGNPVVNYAFPFGRSQTFNRNAKVWQVNHNFNTTPVLVQVMNSGDEVVIPDKADVSNPNTAWFYFHAVTEGKVMITSGGSGSLNLADITVTDGINSHASQTLNFSGDDFYISTDLDGNPVVNLLA